MVFAGRGICIVVVLRCAHSAFGYPIKDAEPVPIRENDGGNGISGLVPGTINS
jgi:hypothetical protein